ncbi:hypothetical protein ANCCAN_13741 [Ancylostoma caninum]|uniref:Uncharacterized protein n=1 Tax=Ancylostoma caninum TaxID=29170 RepID=A0A368GC02_ANCCA|nr:hypothetical protein ANCCAN_13741 [Ancylostoma caninum]
MRDLREQFGRIKQFGMKVRLDKNCVSFNKFDFEKQQIEWREEHQRSFDQLKLKLTSTPVLAAPIPGKP